MIYRHGECEKLESNPCDELELDQYNGAYCEIDTDGRAMCKCTTNCELVTSIFKNLCVSLFSISLFYLNP
jgi:hypothetical protein